MNKNTKLIATLSLTGVFLVIAFGLVVKATNNIYSKDPNYTRFNLALIFMVLSFVTMLGAIAWLSFQEAKIQPRRKYFPLLAAFAVGILVAVVWMVIYTQPN